MIPQKDLTAVILAGGKNKKGIASLRDVDGKKVIERQAAVLKPKVSRIEVSVSVPTAWSRFPVVVDRFPPIGPLAGIASALDGASTDYVLIVHGAFAWLKADVLDLLVARSGEPFDACAFRFNYADPNPLFTIYHRRCAPRAIARLERGDHDAVGLLTSESLAVRWIEDYELQAFDPEMATFKKASSGFETDPAEEPKAAAAVQTITVDPSNCNFAFQAKPAYQAALALMPIVHALATGELGAELTRSAAAVLVAVANGSSTQSAAFACVALLDALRVVGVSDPRIAEAQALLKQLAD